MDQERKERRVFQDLLALPCTTALLVVIWLIFGVEIYAHALGNQAVLLRMGALSMDAIPRGECWRLFTYALLHSGWWHIAVNTSLLLVAGPVVERTLGSWFTLAVSILGAALGGGAILLVHHGKVGSIEVGASGAFFALVAAALVMSWQPRPAKASRIYRRLVAILLVGLAISFLPEISMAAHLAGLTVGFVLSLAMRLRDTTKPSGLNAGPG